MTDIHLAFLWHMHQPIYRLRNERSCFMPWVRLHAIRSYYDMIRVLDEFPEARVTFNLVPSMMAQLDAYNQGMTDQFAEISQLPQEDFGEREKMFLLEHFFSAHPEQMIGRCARYEELLIKRNQALRLKGPAEAWEELSHNDYQDLKALFDLAWFGFKAREDFPEIEELWRRGTGFSNEEIHHIHEIEKEILKRVPELYKKASERGQIEISTTPYSHPILPLLADTDSAREAMPQATLPGRMQRMEDVQHQIRDGLDFMEKLLGVRPKGMWPSEGSVSQLVAEELSRAGLSWAASDEEVLARSKRQEGANPKFPWNVHGTDPHFSMVFRDRDLSDRVGFRYAKRNPVEAVNDFIGNVLERFQHTQDQGSFLLVALDGENPWEHFPNGGAEFLRTLYGKIREYSNLKLSTISDAIQSSKHQGRIDRLHAGSWINADFGTWIGGPEKNQAWSILQKVRDELDSDLQRGPGHPGVHEAWASLRAAEASDWFWWLDGQFTSSHRQQFDEAFRGHLKQAYEALNRKAPDFLQWFIPSSQKANDARHEPLHKLSPTIDGYESSFFEWLGALYLPWRSSVQGSTMQQSEQPWLGLHLAFSPKNEFLLRLDPTPEHAPHLNKKLCLDLAFHVERNVRTIQVCMDEEGNVVCSRVMDGLADSFETNQGDPLEINGKRKKVLELAIPSEPLGLTPNKRALFLLKISTPDSTISLREIMIQTPSNGVKEVSGTSS